jgi:hypothetical protein
MCETLPLIANRDRAAFRIVGLVVAVRRPPRVMLSLD